jgi:hypothetical protein
MRPSVRARLRRETKLPLMQLSPFAPKTSGIDALMASNRAPVVVSKMESTSLIEKI